MVAGIVLIIIIMITAAFAGCVSENNESKNSNLEESENGNLEEPEDQPDDTEVPDDEDGNDGEPPEIDETEAEAEGTTGAAGTVEAFAQASPDTVSETVEINIPEDTITSVDFVIRVEDGDDGTNADEVSGSIDSTGGHNEPLPQGQTLYTSTINIIAPEGQYLPKSWTISLEVVCHASDSQTSGVLVWVGTPDYGFSYNVSVTYKYIK
jgi:hypothetical protein